jgi:hypothetical protein
MYTSFLPNVSSQTALVAPGVFGQLMKIIEEDAFSSVENISSIYLAAEARTIN